MLKYIILTVLLIILIIILLMIEKKNIIIKEHFSDTLKNVDLMTNEIDTIIDKEKETRLFCKLIRNNKLKDLNEKILNQREKIFSENLKKQEEKISALKKKIIEIKLNKNNKHFIDFNKNRNTTIQANRKREHIIHNAKNKIKKKPELNINMNYN